LNRHTRYQGAIVRDHHILVLKQRIFPIGRVCWIFPGGGIEPGETEEECVKREMKEETNLDVEVKRLLLDEPRLMKIEIMSNTEHTCVSR
jgi:8-oxo-dGTP diphosphatase